MLHQGNPAQVAEQTARGDADVGIATEALAELPDLVDAALLSMEPLRARSARAIRSAKERPLTLEAIARYPIVTYDFTFTGRSRSTRRSPPRGSSPTSC